MMSKKRIEDRGAVVGRRDTLIAMVGVGLGLPLAREAHADEAQAAAPPREGDLVVYAYGDRAGEPIAADDLEMGGPQIFAYPMDRESRVVRSGSRLNQLLLVRIAADELAADTRARAASNVVAYSAVCTHTGCDVTDWDREAQRFQCPCHDSQFDPANGARVVGGPAPRPLPSLPLGIDDGLLSVAGDFDAPVGFQQPGLDPFGF